MKLEFESNVAAASSSFADSTYTADIDSASEKESARMLQAGIKAAQSGNRNEARALLLQVTESSPDNEHAWLWLASISDYPEELLVFLNNVLKINANNARALEWSRATKSLLAKNFVQRGVDASNEAQMDLARQYFLQAVVHDDRNEMAWFWLASISDSAEEKLSHLQNVLNINPENETALKALQLAKSQITESLLRKANTAAIAGERETAHEMLQTVLKQTPESEEAWILKSYLADSFSDKVVCFERVLSINPENDAAISGLASLREMMAQTETKKSQNLAIIAEFLATPPAETVENQIEEVELAEESAADETADSSLEFGEIIEDAPEFFSEAAPIAQPTYEDEFAPTVIEVEPAADAPENNFYQEEIVEIYQEPEMPEQPDYHQSAEAFVEPEIVEEPVAELPNNVVEEETSQTNFNYPDYSKQEDFEHSEQTVSDYPEPEVSEPQNHSDYSAPEVSEPLADQQLEFDSEPTLEPDYSSANVTVEEPFQETKPAAKKILVVDDSATVRKLIAQKLEMSGYEVLCSSDSGEALELLKQIVPDLILLDTAMPQMDGYQICQSIRGNAATKEVPVIMISGKDGFFDKVRGQMSGSTGYIAKPFGPETLMKTVESYITQ